MKEFITGLYPTLNTIYALLSAYLVFVLSNYIKAKNLLATLTHYKEVGDLIWAKLNEDARLGKFLGDKEAQFMILIQKHFPKMTTAQANLINKGKAGVVNFGKDVIKEAEIPGIPIITYFDPLTGAPLTPGVLPVMPV